MLRLVHPAREGQDPPTRRKRSPSPVFSLAGAEKQHLRATLHNLRRSFGTWGQLAAAVGVSVNVLTHAAADRTPRGSIALAYRVAKVASMSVESILSGTIATADRCPTCGHRAGDGRLVAGGAS